MPVHRQRTFDLADTAVGATLRAARLGARLEQRDLAASVGIDLRVLSRIELGQRPCRVTELVALAAASGVKPETLIEAATKRRAQPHGVSRP